MDPKAAEMMKKFRTMVFEAVESLLPAGISKEGMEEACPNLDTSSFADVAEERALANFCGYPPCSNRLQAKKWQKYLIRGHRVYDTEERRRFCSDICYECFVFISKQLPEEPLWFRGPRPDGERFRLAFLEDNEQKKNGLPGKEVPLILNDLVDAFDQLKLERESGDDRKDSLPFAAKKPNAEMDDFASVSAFSDNVTLSLAELLCENGSDDEGTDQDEEPLQKHIDCEKSALGMWEPSKKDKRPTEKKPPRRTIVIDPLPLPPKIVASNEV